MVDDDGGGAIFAGAPIVVLAALADFVTSVILHFGSLPCFAALLPVPAEIDHLPAQLYLHSKSCACIPQSAAARVLDIPAGTADDGKKRRAHAIAPMMVIVREMEKMKKAKRRWMNWRRLEAKTGP